MNNADLINHVAKSVGISKSQAGDAVESMLSGIQNTLADGGLVSLVGFGVFSVTSRAARTARNPRTGEPIEVPAANAPKFKPGKVLKCAVK